MPFTTVRRYKDCISGNRRRRLTEGEREKKEDVVRRREDPTYTFLYLLPQPKRSPQSSTFDQTLIYSLLFSSYIPLLPLPLILSIQLYILPSNPFPPLRRRDTKQKILRTIRRLRLSPSICRKAKENTSIAIDQTRIRLQKNSSISLCRKKKKEERRRKRRKREKKKNTL